MLKYLPTAGGSGLVFYGTPIIQDFDSFITRADYNISGNDRLVFRFNKDWHNLNYAHAWYSSPPDPML